MESITKSKEMHEKRQKHVTECLNPHEKEMKAFIDEVINEYNIKTNDEWLKYEHLIPDSASKLMFTIHFQKQI